MYFLHAINSDRQTRLLNVLGQIAMILGDKKNSKRSLMIIICVQRECNGVAEEVTYLNAQSWILLERTEANQAVPNLLTVHAAFSRQTSRALQSSVSPAKFKSRSGDPLFCLFIVSLVQGKFGTLCEIRIRRLISTPRSVLYLLIMLSFDAIGYNVYWPPDSRQTNHRHEYFSEIGFVQFQNYLGRTALFHSLSFFPGRSKLLWAVLLAYLFDMTPKLTV